MKLITSEDAAKQAKKLSKALPLQHPPFAAFSGIPFSPVFLIRILYGLVAFSSISFNSSTVNV